MSKLNRFARTRQDHQQETAEDYVELIANLTQERGEARTTDIAERLGVSKVTVSKTIQRLVREGLVTSEPYRSIFLTPAGQEMAANAKIRHDIVYSFLLNLGVPAQIAEIDSEGIEHHVSQETLQAMKAFLKSKNA